MSAPTIAGWNLALRFGLEVGALAGLGAAAWKLTPGPLRWVAMIVVPVVAAIAWGVFNVVGDPSRSGAAPIEVDGWTRLAVELAVLSLGATAVWMTGRYELAIAFAALVVVQYATSWERVQWLVEQQPSVA